MDETMNENQQGKGGSKKLLAIVIAAVLIVGGAITAFALLNKSPKEKYFLAEKESMDHVVDHVKEQYAPEMDWYEKTQKNPVKTDMEITGNYESPFGGLSSGDMFSPEQFINNSKLKLSTQSDLKNKLASLTINGSMGDIETGDISAYLTEDKLSVQLPFLDELLQIKDKDLAKLIEEENPDVKLDGSLDFGKFFEQNSLPEEDIEYLKDEYLGMIYDDLPDDSFKSSDEKIDVNGKSVKTEKIKMHLTEKEIKDILSHVFTKASKDKKLMKIIKDQYQMQEFGAGLFVPQQTAEMESMTDEMIKDFEQAMKDANKGLKDVKIPDGLTSTIWVHDKLIVKRDFSIKAGPDKEQLVAFNIKGTQTLEKEKQQFDYTLGYKDQYDEGDMKLNGTLSNKDGKIKNNIKLAVADAEISFDADETLKDGKRDFERKLTFNGDGQGGGIVWSGDADYDKDQMKSNHKLTLDGDFLNGTKIALNLKNSAKTIKKVELPKDDNVKDLGKMKIDEIEQYFMNDVSQKAQQYMLQMIGPGF